MGTKLAVGFVLAALSGTAVFGASPAELEPLAFLIGEWSASGSGQPGESSGTAVFSRALQDRVMLRSSFAESPAAPGRAGARHEDLMVIYVAAGGGVRADYYDNEGHAIRYIVQSPVPDEALFLSEATSNEPRFRLGYKLEATGVLRGEFAIAPPGAPDAFKPYLAWESRKTKLGAK